MTYWANKGTYEEEAKALNLLVPASGESETLKGEIWRAATKIYHDYFNNGFGNFWMAPAAYLITNVELPDRVKQILFDHANGNMASGHFAKDMDAMIDSAIIALREMEDKPNTCDMWEFEAPYSINMEFLEEEQFDEDEDWAYDDEDY
jgi:hypothetical protein